MNHIISSCTVIAFADCPHCHQKVDIEVRMDHGEAIIIDQQCPECKGKVDTWENLEYEPIVIGDTTIVLQGNKLTSEMHSSCDCESCLEYNAMIDGLESLVLALHMEGIDYEDKAFERGIRTAFQAICHHISDCRKAESNG